MTYKTIPDRLDDLAESVATVGVYKVPRLLRTAAKIIREQQDGLAERGREINRLKDRIEGVKNMCLKADTKDTDLFLRILRAFDASKPPIDDISGPKSTGDNLGVIDSTENNNPDREQSAENTTQEPQSSRAGIDVEGRGLTCRRDPSRQCTWPRTDRCYCDVENRGQCGVARVLESSDERIVFPCSFHKGHDGAHEWETAPESHETPLPNGNKDTEKLTEGDESARAGIRPYAATECPHDSYEQGMLTGKKFCEGCGEPWEIVSEGHGND